jgi:hypothetical protein
MKTYLPKNFSNLTGKGIKLKLAIVIFVLLNSIQVISTAQTVMTFSLGPTSGTSSAVVNFANGPVYRNTGNAGL